MGQEKRGENRGKTRVERHAKCIECRSFFDG
jgi:hypothetical protein